MVRVGPGTPEPLHALCPWWLAKTSRPEPPEEFRVLFCEFSWEKSVFFGCQCEKCTSSGNDALGDLPTRSPPPPLLQGPAMVVLVLVVMMTTTTMMSIRVSAVMFVVAEAKPVCSDDLSLGCGIEFAAHTIDGFLLRSDDRSVRLSVRPSVRPSILPITSLLFRSAIRLLRRSSVRPKLRTDIYLCSCRVVTVLGDDCQCPTNASVSAKTSSSNAMR